MVDEYTKKGEDVVTLKVGNRGKKHGTCPSLRYSVCGPSSPKRWERTEKTLRKGVGCWWRDGYSYRTKSVPLMTECNRVVSHVVSTAQSGSVMRAGGECVEYRKRSSWVVRARWRKLTMKNVLGGIKTQNPKP